VLSTIKSMNLSEKQIEDFQSLYREKFGEEITSVEAAERAMKLVLLFQAVYKKNVISTNNKHKPNFHNKLKE